MRIQQLNRFRSASPRMIRQRLGFTLIEVLTVIAIIGILVGLLLAAVGPIRRTVRNAAISFEVKAIDAALNQYQAKYDSYPPDGSNQAQLIAHLRKAFPNIATSEINLLIRDTFPGTNAPLVNFTNGAPSGVMDPCEALVFFLGGFSEDATFPLSGEGGPFFIADANGNRMDSDKPVANRASVQYNVSRNNPLYDFSDGKLYIDQDINAPGFTVSSDETDLFANGTFDCLPAYAISGTSAPLVYFNNRTYSYDTPNGKYFNHYRPTGSLVSGVARPYKSVDVNTTIPQARDADAHFRYMEEDKFQIIAAGLDEDFGGIPQSGPAPVFYKFPSGEQLDITQPGGGSGFSRYTETTGIPSSQLDNIVNFADSTLENAIDQ
ncbi:MAG: type II secretion system protein [Aureliella sp.]